MKKRRPPRDFRAGDTVRRRDRKRAAGRAKIRIVLGDGRVMLDTRLDGFFTWNVADLARTRP